MAGLNALGGYGSGSSSDDSDNEVETPKVSEEEKLLHLKVSLRVYLLKFKLYTLLCKGLYRIRPDIRPIILQDTDNRPDKRINSKYRNYFFLNV